MKILFVAVFSYNSTNVSQAHGFRTNGHHVVEFDYRHVATQAGDNANRDSILIQFCQNEKPDVVVFSKCNEISSRVVSECNKVCKTVLWYMDPVNENFNSSLIEKINLCTYTFCALWDAYLTAKKIGGDKVFFLQEGYDQTSNFPVKSKYVYDVSFIGALRNKRFAYHKAVGFDVIQSAYGKEHSLAVAQSKINLNFTEGGTSDRTYKVLASRGFLLTEPWISMENDFTTGQDFDIFTNANELKEKISYYLEHEDERLRIAEHGYQTVQKFDRINWAKQIIDKL